MRDLETYLADEVKDIIGKSVNVMSGKKVLHKGVVLGNTVSGIQVGITWTSLAGATKKPGQKYISVFYTQKKKLAVTN